MYMRIYTCMYPFIICSHNTVVYVHVCKWDMYMHDCVFCVCFQEFFQSLEKETGYEMVNLTNVHSIYGVLFVEVR